MNKTAADSGGYLMVEVVVATLLLLVMASGVAGTLLTGRMSVGRTQRRAAATQGARRVLEALKAYETADTTVVAGPGNAPNGWGMPGDGCGCAALAAGTHVLSTAVWAPELAAQSGAVSYQVTTQATALGPLPTVAINVAWHEPGP